MNENRIVARNIVAVYMQCVHVLGAAAKCRAGATFNMHGVVEHLMADIYESRAPVRYRHGVVCSRRITSILSLVCTTRLCFPQSTQAETIGTRRSPNLSPFRLCAYVRARVCGRRVCAYCTCNLPSGAQNDIFDFSPHMHLTMKHRAATFKQLANRL